MAIPWRQMTLVALAGDALLFAVNDVRSRRHLVAAFALLWLIQLLAWGIWSTLVYPHFVSPLRHLPQPGRAHWLLGHGGGSHQTDFGASARQWVTNIEHNHFIRYLDFFNKECLLVTSPEAITEILISNNYIFPKTALSRYFLGRYTGHGIGSAERDEHKVQRRQLSLAFSLRHIKDLYPTFWAKGGETVRAIVSQTPRHGNNLATIDIHPWAVRCALDVVGTTSMGVEIGAIQDENNFLFGAFSRLCDISMLQDGVLILLGLCLPEGLLRQIPSKRNREINDALEQIRTACRDGIQARRKTMAEKQDKQPDICSVALESGHFSDDELVEQLFTFLFAGQHAIGKTMTAAVYALCLFPDKQRRLREEVRRCLPSLDAAGDICSADMDNMPYLNAVCKEVLRKYSVGIASREAAHDTTIQGQRIPRGTTIKVATFGTSADPMLWGDDAGEFKPERWLADETECPTDTKMRANGGATSNYAFLPFMHGPQGCMAVRFAQAELACLLAAWIGRLEFTLHDKSLMDERNLPRSALQTKLEVCVKVVEGW